ncbi:beta-1,4-galactosyltransferase galt-1 [Plakobranchus ocellatus]|uniref:Glycosyltransferase family 92 protein n=1 Tax=Plakobranchus ocellatus TaxID=259542 RepID=A0AAV4BE02_9GAST|nr:beta-1,4-galactosyltransferase galt-1 [Plakobranchus ocellatus]
MLSNAVRAARRPAAVLSSAAEVVYMMMVHLTNSRPKKFLLAGLVGACALYVFSIRGPAQVGRYEPWTAIKLPRPKAHLHKHFLRSRDQELYIYSAIANPHYPVNREVNIVFTVMDQTRSRSLDCCVLLDNRTVFISPASKYFYYRSVNFPVVSDIDEYMHPEAYLARQYTCTVPETGHQIHHATLTSSQCSSDPRDYIPVHYPARVPGGLAICGKVAYGGALDPEKLIEWFEMQRLLGVDKVLIYELNNPENVMRVFKHYQKMGFLDLQPYELPGRPYNRTMNDKSFYQFHHDESLAVLECRQRMGGYTYVMSHDLDEFIIPRKDIGLKPFFQEKMQQYQDSAGFYFYAEFFVYGWGPTNPEEDMMLTRYRRATQPHWECTKYVFMPARVVSITTHSIFAMSHFSTYKIGPEEAVLHHYRDCPHVWKSCKPDDTIVDDVMLRFRLLYPRVLGVRSELGFKAMWTDKKH